MTADKYHQIFANKSTVMVIMAHPDDLEVFCGGTVARLIDDGKRVISIKITTGNRGSKDQAISADQLGKQRLAEDARAMEILGIPTYDSINLMLNDGEVENSLEDIERLAFYIRKFQPDLIITTNPEHIIIRHSPGTNWINHRDHRHTAMNALDAAYPYSRDRAFFSEHFDDPDITPGHCIEFLIADSWDGVDEVLIDVAQYVDKKLEAMICHESQVSTTAAKESVEFFTQHEGIDGQFEKFRYIVAD